MKLKIIIFLHKSHVKKLKIKINKQKIKNNKVIGNTLVFGSKEPRFKSRYGIDSEINQFFNNFPYQKSCF